MWSKFPAIHRFYGRVFRLFRKRRMAKFSEEFRIAEHTRVLDVGGTLTNWRFIGRAPRLTLVNLDLKVDCQPGVLAVIADGRQLPFKDKAFDVVYSNSVIEHLATFANQVQFALECRRVGLRYYVQTPNKWFIIEPHLLALFIHWLPEGWQKYLLRYFSVWGWITRPSQSDCEGFLEEVRLLDQSEMEKLFPEATIWRERFMMLTKSLIAVK